MKKVFFVIPITILFVLLSENIKTYAAAYYTGNAYYSYPNWDGYIGKMIILTSETHWESATYISGVLSGPSNTEARGYSSADEAITASISQSGDNYGPEWVGTGGINLSGVEKIVGLPPNPFTGETYDSVDDFLNPPQELTWFEIWSNNVQEFLEGWLPWAVDLDHAFDDLTMWLFGMELSGDDVQYGNDIEFYDFPTPTPYPTQIPYQQQVVPDGNGGFTVQYVYLNPSGTPVTATAPPPEPTYTIKITDSPQYDISGVPVPPADGLQDAIDAIDDNIDEYQVGFEAVQGSFSTLPIKWYFFFGVPAAILLIAGIIRSLLGG